MIIFSSQQQNYNFSFSQHESNLTPIQILNSFPHYNNETSFSSLRHRPDSLLEFHKHDAQLKSLGTFKIDQVFMTSA